MPSAHPIFEMKNDQTARWQYTTRASGRSEGCPAVTPRFESIPTWGN
jgi:hypothetical protein